MSTGQVSANGDRCECGEVCLQIEDPGALSDQVSDRHGQGPCPFFLVLSVPNPARFSSMPEPFLVDKAAATIAEANLHQPDRSPTTLTVVLRAMTPMLGSPFPGPWRTVTSAMARYVRLGRMLGLISGTSVVSGYQNRSAAGRCGTDAMPLDIFKALSCGGAAVVIGTSAAASVAKGRSATTTACCAAASRFAMAASSGASCCARIGSTIASPAAPRLSWSRPRRLYAKYAVGFQLYGMGVVGQRHHLIAPLGRGGAADIRDVRNSIVVLSSGVRVKVWE